MKTTQENDVFEVPTREQVSEANQVIFDQMLSSFGKIPNLYATFAINETALSDYLTLQNRKSTLSNKEREIVNLVVSQVNDCKYCVPAHTAVAKMFGFTDDEVLQIRRNQISFDERFSALANFVKEVTINRGRPSQNTTDKLYEAGYTKPNIIDIMMVIGDKIISNYLHNFTQIPVDWSEVPNI